MTEPQNNTPELWKHYLPLLTESDHKYSRGHVVVNGGPSTMTGAARLAALSALRIGAGLVTITIPPEALPIYAASLLAVMVKPISDFEDYSNFIEARRAHALLLGNGNGHDERTRTLTLSALASEKPCVLDADSLTVFEDDSETLFSAITASVVMTPHEGEFARLFGIEGTREERAHAASVASGAMIVLKGAQTLIAAPDGRLVINRNAPPFLATAGSGDVLAGMIAGLLAQGIEPFNAACIAVWMHGAAASSFGRGLIADDLPNLIPKVLSQLP